ncbi:hypothetical protein NP493_409g07040 [Ridgeia piscesae]|uniref:Uncharacterized protein n=1 Tax=Ridgeia piscesae TaxID=27915 RepID=A0AAD9L0L8_RIDPI|nr:hypothetical protein NP493_409g07040 [Ridgeia piscesae]
MHLLCQIHRLYTCLVSRKPHSYNMAYVTCDTHLLQIIRLYIYMPVFAKVPIMCPCCILLITSSQCFGLPYRNGYNYCPLLVKN